MPTRIPTEVEKEVFADLLQYAADCIRYYKRMSAQPDCNNCGKLFNCEYMPKCGETVRINCPHWEKEENNENQS